MIVFYADKIVDESITLTDDEFRHCIKVLRKKIGDEISVFDQDGNTYQAVIKEIKKDSVNASITNYNAKINLQHHFCLAIAPTKKADRIEWMVSKAVEIGVQEIWLVKTKRTEFAKYKLDRLNKIVLSAAKQSLNFKLPIIKEYDSLALIFNQIDLYSKRFIAHCMDPKAHLMNKKLSKEDKVIVLVGPEGDFTEGELTGAFDHGFEEISLGKSRLRTETAGIVALTLLNAILQR